MNKILKKKTETIRNRFYNYWHYLQGGQSMVLLYHRVCSLDSDPQLLSVSPENFYDQVSYLKKEYALLTADEFADFVTRNKSLPPKSILLTFDDGYADNFKTALPILESLGAQALFFITTSNIDTNKELWWDELERIFLTTDKLPEVLVLKTENNTAFATESEMDRNNIYHKLHPKIKYSHFKEREKMLSDFRTWAGISNTGRETHRLMSWDEVVQMSKSKSAVIGAHTVHHVPLSVINYNEQLKEIKDSKDQLESRLQLPVKYFSYPYGAKKDYNADSINICKSLGFTLSFSNFPGYIGRHTDKFQLPRVLVRNINLSEFKTHLKKFHG